MKTTGLTLPYLKLKITFRDLEKTVFTAYPGSSIRDMFRTALRQECCSRQTCVPTKCKLLSSCGYAALCQPLDPKGVPAINPYVFTIPPRQNYIFKKGEEFDIFLTLFGPAAKWLKEIVSAFSRMEKLDIGKFHRLITLEEIRRLGLPEHWPASCRPRGKFRVSAVELEEKGEITEDCFRQSSHDRFSFREIKLQLLSPCRIIHTVTPVVTGSRKRLPLPAGQFSVGAVLNSIYYRLSGLASPEAAEAIIKPASSLTVDIGAPEQHTVKDIKISRYSASMKRARPNDGVIGTISWPDFPLNVLSVLNVGEIIHVGSGSTMGFGQIKVRVAPC